MIMSGAVAIACTSEDRGKVSVKLRVINLFTIRLPDAVCGLYRPLPAWKPILTMGVGITLLDADEISRRESPTNSSPAFIIRASCIKESRVT